MDTLKTRAEFLRVAKGHRTARRSLVLQSNKRGPADDCPPRFGFTATRKIGNAVIRNRTKRRLRAAVRSIAPRRAASGYDYVLIGRRATSLVAFANILDDLELAFTKLHATDGSQA